jgi:hypothetical protein
MKFLSKAKDGGPDSPVDGFFLFEIKGLCSVVLLKFNKGRREAFHTHAFNALTWFIYGDLTEEKYGGDNLKYKLSLVPKYTPKSNNHRVFANKASWCLSVRGRWSNTWTEHHGDEEVVLTHGRLRLSR